MGGDVQQRTIEEIPPIQWNLVGSIPDDAYLMDFAINDSDQIWISYGDGGQNQLVLYSLDKNEKEIYTLDKNDFVLPIHKLFFSKNGILWAENYVFQSHQEGIPLLSQYNASIDRFNFILDNQGVLQSPREIRSDVVEDNKGLFWMFVKDADLNVSTLYSFDPETLEVERQPLQLQGEFLLLNIAPDGSSLWSEDQVNGKIIQYFIDDQTTKLFDSITNNEPDIPSIDLSNLLRQPLTKYFDWSQRFWLDHEGWVDFSDTEHLVFYKLIPPPEFIRYAESPEPGYGWVETMAIFESSNGLVWFSTTGGVISLDIREGYEKGKWCMITNGYSPVKEDSQHNLWMVVYNKIYKYQIIR